MSELLDRQLIALQTRWPQSHYEPGKHGAHLIIVPGVKLPDGYTHTICTVLFVAPPGYPAARPDHFFTDSAKIRLANKMQIQGTNTLNRPWGFDQWTDVTWWSWHLQTWDPNRDTLMTFMNVIRHRLNPAR
jgi:Prokaryotic E2 family E